MTVVLLDSGLPSTVIHPRTSPENIACKAWLFAFLAQGHSIFVPEITCREVRCAALENGVPSRGLAHLEACVAASLATESWAQVRHLHIEGALETALDAGMTLCASAETLPPDWTQMATLSSSPLSSTSPTSPMPATGETFPE